ncbi:ATP-binding protein [Paenibacillus harenae]|uniref:ATP-binding protein n=1 Tax=Paenibacillus harenae TaxID=306543 RepID=UPI0027911DEB|nr:ATP-binding protein [Paenibacillus harenae]MDQ0063526.1 two-component system sensor histidine kinase ComP [Paenibacillus harenae]
MSTNTRNRAAFLLLLVAILTILTYITVIIVREPFIGAEVFRNEAGEYVVKLVEPAGQAQIKGIRAGDVILTVNGVPAAHYQNANKFNWIEKAEDVSIRHSDGTMQSITFTRGWDGDHSSWEMLIQLYVPLTSFLIFSALSLLLYMKRRNDKAALMLISFFVIIGLSYYCSAATYRSDRIGMSLLYLLLPNIPISFMLFMNKYLSRFNVTFIRKKQIAFLSVIFFAVTVSCLLYVWTSYISTEVFFYIKMLYFGILFFSNFIVIIQLIRKFLNHRNTKLNSLFKITLVSHIVAFTPFTTMNLLPLLVGGGQILPAAFTALFLFVLPIVYFYLLTSNQLFDIDFILTRFKYYTLIAIVPSMAIAVVLLFIVSNTNYNSTWSSGFIVFVVIYIGMTLFLYAKEQIDHRYRPKLFKAMYSYQDSLDRFSRKIARVMKQADLEEILKQEINELLPVNRIHFLLVDYSENVVYPMGEKPDELITGEFLLGASYSMQVGELIDLPYGLGLVIGRQRTRYHILWIGMKTNHTRFNSDELRWLKTMSNYASIVFENLYLIEGLIEDLESELKKEHNTSPWVLRLLFCLSENERRKLAADLHDSALQDQLLWYRKLEAIMMDHPMTDKLDMELQDIKEGLLDVIHQIRETCNELRPPLLKEMGVIEAVESIIELTLMRVNFEVDFHAKPFDRPLNEEQITAIYRIVQELLRNADKHANAKLIRLELEMKHDVIYFRYKDDGIGMDVNQMIATFEHMGLSGIKERVTSLEGDITFHSQRGSGLEVIILIPEKMTSGLSEMGISRDSYLIS